MTIDSYDTLFIICALVVTASALSSRALRETGATGVRAFFASLGSGSAIRADVDPELWGAHLRRTPQGTDLRLGARAARSSRKS